MKKRRGAASGSFVALALSIVALIIAVAIMFPIAGKLIFNANMTGWDSTSKSTFPVIFLVGIAVVVIAMIRGGFMHK